MLNICLGIVIAFGIALAGLIDDLARAQQFERTGDFESALIIFRNLYADHSTQPGVVDGLKRNYRRLEQYDELVLLLKHMRERDPGNRAVVLELAEMLFVTRRAEQADTLLNGLAAGASVSPELYHRIAAVYAKFGRWEDARRQYAAARTASGDDRLFIDETALTWLKGKEYRKAGTEYLKHFARYDKNEYEHILEKLDLFPQDPAVFGLLAEVIDEAAAAVPEKKRIHLYKLKSELFLMFGRYEEAFSEKKRIDRLTGRQGKVLLEFSRYCRQEGQLRLAVRAGAELERAWPGSRHLPDVYADRARAWTDLGNYERALAVYDSLVTRFPKSGQVNHAWYRMGEIHFEHTGRLDKAIGYFNRVLKNRPGNDLLFDAYFRIGDSYVKKGDIKNALKMFDLLAKKTASRKDLHDRAVFKKAETEYLAGNLDGARKLLGTLTVKGSESLYLNDALELSILLHKDNAPALPGFAAAEFLYRQGKTEEARREWEKVLGAHRGILTGTILLRVAGALEDEGGFADAAGAYRRIMGAKVREGIAVTARVRLGILYEEKLEQPDKAIEVYKKIIASWPRSPHVPRVRRRLRKLVKSI